MEFIRLLKNTSVVLISFLILNIYSLLSLCSFICFLLSSSPHSVHIPAPLPQIWVSLLLCSCGVSRCPHGGGLCLGPCVWLGRRGGASPSRPQGQSWLLQRASIGHKAHVQISPTAQCLAWFQMWMGNKGIFNSSLVG